MTSDTSADGSTARSVAAVPGALATSVAVRLPRWLLSPRLIPWAVAAVTFLTVAPAIWNDFVEWDDYANIVQNEQFRGLGWVQLRWMFSTILMGHYIPLTWLTFGLDYVLWGMNPAGYHLTNVVLHTSNAVLLYHVARRLLVATATFSPGVLQGGAAAAALFFALHPLRAESVAWATERRDMLSGLFFLATILLYLRARDHVGGRRRRLLVASLGCFILAIVSKAIVMTLPLVLILIDVYPLRRLGHWRQWPAAREVWREKLPYLALGLVAAVLGFFGQAANSFFTSYDRYPWPARLAITAYGLWFYVSRTVMPIGLSPLYELPLRLDPLEPRFVLSGLAILVVTAGVVLLRRRWPGGLAVWASYVITVAPVSGILHAGFQLAHDRYSYLPSLGWALGFGGVVALLARATGQGALRPALGRLGVAVAVAWLVALGVMTWNQVQVWRDTLTLWQYAVDAEPTCAICRSNLGATLYNRGYTVQAKAELEHALTLRSWPRTRHNLGLALARLDDVPGAIRSFEQVLATHPDEIDTLNNLAVLLMYRGRHEEALPRLQRALRLKPEHPPTHVNLGVYLVERGRPREAVAAFQRAIELRPIESQAHYGLTRARLALGDRDGAWAAYERVRTLDARMASWLGPAFLEAW